MCKYPESDLIYSRALKNFNFFSQLYCRLPINFEAEEILSFPTFRCSSAAKSIHFLICLEYLQLYPNIMFNIWFPLHVLIVLQTRICLEQECFRYPEFEIKWGRLCVLKLEPRGIYFVESWILSCSYCYRSLVLVFPVCVCSVPRHLFISFVAEFNYHYLYQMHNHTKSLSSSLSLANSPCKPNCLLVHGKSWPCLAHGASRVITTKSPASIRSASERNAH